MENGMSSMDSARFVAVTIICSKSSSSACFVSCAIAPELSKLITAMLTVLRRNDEFSSLNISPSRLVVSILLLGKGVMWQKGGGFSIDTRINISTLVEYLEVYFNCNRNVNFGAALGAVVNLRLKGQKKRLSS